jgi:hypothetical protein
MGRSYSISGEMSAYRIPVRILRKTRANLKEILTYTPNAEVQKASMWSCGYTSWWWISTNKTPQHRKCHVFLPIFMHACPYHGIWATWIWLGIDVESEFLMLWNWDMPATGENSGRKTMTPQGDRHRIDNPTQKNCHKIRGRPGLT